MLCYIFKWYIFGVKSAIMLLLLTVIGPWVTKLSHHEQPLRALSTTRNILPCEDLTLGLKLQVLMTQNSPEAFTAGQRRNFTNKSFISSNAGVTCWSESLPCGACSEHNGLGFCREAVIFVWYNWNQYDSVLGIQQRCSCVWDELWFSGGNWTAGGPKCNTLNSNMTAWIIWRWGK